MVFCSDVFSTSSEPLGTSPKLASKHQQKMKSSLTRITLLEGTPKNIEIEMLVLPTGITLPTVAFLVHSSKYNFLL